MQKLTQEIITLSKIRKKTLFGIALLLSLAISIILTGLDNVCSGIADGLHGTHAHDPRK